MKPFLKEFADEVLSRFKTLEDKTIVFPNQRAIIYFQHYLAQGLKKPLWSPHILSIEGFFKKHSALKEAAKLELISKLYKVYKKIVQTSESFDQFYYWGEIILADFNDIDKQLVNGKQLYSDLRQIKELDSSFDYLTEAQKELLKTFWSRVNEKNGEGEQSIDVKKKFLTLWNHLSKVYQTYVDELRQDGLGYLGMMQREVAENILSKPNTYLFNNQQFIFVGFNGLTKAEEIVITHCVEEGAEIFWDLDSYYVDQKIQEAGFFFRQYRSHNVLGKTFLKTNPANFKESPKQINLTGVPNRIGQAKLVGEKLMEIISRCEGNSKDEELSDTVIVLPDPKMLLPVIRSLPQEVQHVNVTMGFPLQETQLFNFLELIIELQINQQEEVLLTTHFANISNHSAIAEALSVEDKDFINKHIEAKKIVIPIVELQGRSKAFSLIFRIVEPKDATNYLLEIIQFLGTSYSENQSFEKESAYHFYKHLSDLKLILSDEVRIESWAGLKKLFSQVIAFEHIPFRGEPVRGLQIMGVLETRSLDFKNVIVVSMNEGIWPGSSTENSYIPRSIRKAYGLPTSDYRDAIFAYLFYRLIQRAKNISFYYSTETDAIGVGEMSRYLNQLLLESGLSIKKSLLHNIIKSKPAKEIVISKTPPILEALNLFLLSNKVAKDSRQMSPTSLNDYIECTLRFYLKHIVNLTEPDKLVSDPDAGLIGQLIHKSLFLIYEKLSEDKKKPIQRQQLADAKNNIEPIIELSCKTANVQMKGQWIIVKEIIKRFVEKVIERDLENTPFEIVFLEEKVTSTISFSNGRELQVKGIIDRVDKKNGNFTIIDYKSGSDEIRFKTLDELTSHDVNRNKAVFQALFYSLLFDHKHHSEKTISAGIYGRKNLFSNPFEYILKMQNTKIENLKPFFDQFQSNLALLIDELFDPSIPFVQTNNVKACLFCPYKSICRR